ncbi:MAG: hypothetical protein IKY71_06130 [Bacteroidaceae bacterium]|nr:hypothetical protein [Bacteroidaceae bacterium]
MTQGYANALRKIRKLSERLFDETDALMEKMDAENGTDGVEVCEDDREVYRVVGMLHNDIEERSAEIENLCTELGID